jgi:hypothetical protein
MTTRWAVVKETTDKNSLLLVYAGIGGKAFLFLEERMKQLII